MNDETSTPASIFRKIGLLAAGLLLVAALAGCASAPAGSDAFYAYSGAVPGTPGTLLRSEPLPQKLGLEAAAAQYRILYTSTNGRTGSGQLGTARTSGPHLYLNTRAESYAVLDSVRAVLGGMKDVANRVILLGQSQGGGAAFATAGYAPSYAPDLKVLGTVATGTPDLAHLGPSPYRPDEVNPTLAYAMYIGLTVQALDAAIRPDQLYTQRALPVYAKAGTICLGPLEHDIRAAGLTNANTLLPGGTPLAFRALGKSLLYPTYKLEQPLFMGTGGADRDVSTAQQLRLAKDACAAGTLVQQHVYPGLSHSETVNASLADSVPFVRSLLAGQPVASACASGP